MKPNYEFILSLLEETILEDDASLSKPKILDFGCGVGEVVQAGLERSFDIYGADTFDGYYEDWRNKLPAETEGKISKIDNNIMAYEDNTFDFVISNQVFEHIEEPFISYKEISRVLKPKGIMYTIFPNKSVWYEGHIGLYFPHWFKRHGYFQRKYLELSYLLGLGRKRHMKVDGWMDILNNVTFHHSIKQIDSEMTEAFKNVPEHIPEKFMRYRVLHSRFKKIHPYLNNIFLRLILLFFARIRAGSVIKAINKNG